MFTLLFVGVNLLTLILVFIGCVIFFRTPKQKLLNLIIITLLGLVAAQMILQWASFGEDVSRFWRWFVNLDDDRNLPATLAAGQWAILGFTAISASFIPMSSIVQRIYWAFVGFLFLFIAIDDFYAIHEYLIPNWRVTYLIIAGILGTFSLVVVGTLFRRDFSKSPRPWIIMALGVIVLGLSGFFIESLLYSACDEMGTSVFCTNFKAVTTIEEGIELLGTTIVSAGLLLYVHNQLPTHIWRKASVLIGGGTVGVVILLFAYIWILPNFALNTTAESVSIVYEEQRIALEGYGLPIDVYQPGDRVYLWLYWKALRNKINDNYRLSVHIIQRPDGTSVAQADRLNMGELPSRIWTKDTVHRKPIHLDLPEDLPTGTYDIGIRVWRGAWQSGWQNTIGLLPEETNLQYLDDEMVIIGDFVVLGDEPKSSQGQTYNFEQGARLVGYEIAESASIGEAVDLNFTWEINQDWNDDYIHFVHFFHQDSDYFAIFDRVPFDARLKTSDWRAGWTITDQFQIQLLDDMPLGTYSVRTGLYRTTDGERAHVTDIDGNAVVDWSINLTNITLQE